MAADIGRYYYSQARRTSPLASGTRVRLATYDCISLVLFVLLSFCLHTYINSFIHGSIYRVAPSYVLPESYELVSSF
jgi:hypothetical protein